MLFNTWTFAVFLVAVFSLYHAIGAWRRSGIVQIVLLIASSLVFYAWHVPWLVLLLAASLAVNGWASRALLEPGATDGRRRVILLSALAANLGALGFFKYASLLTETFLPSDWVRQVAPFLTDIPLPIGISFYTFQGISLVMDSFARRKAGLEGLIDSASRRGVFHAKVWFFVSFFPQLVAGPIVKAHDFVNQIGRKTLRDIDWTGTVRCLVTGFFLKMVVADNLKEITAAIEYPTFTRFSSATLLSLLYGFSFQIFADFAGYSLIAIGLGRLFGYRLPINFNFPYLSESITEFWRRWHISLSTWLRDYLYIPLGGNRKGESRTYVNLFIVMFLGGLWHGAAWSYAVWGMAHGVALAIERAVYGPARNRDPRKSPLWLRLIRIFLTFNVVSFLWLLFKLPDFAHAVEYVSLIFRGSLRMPPQMAYVLLLFSTPVVLYHAWGASLPLRRKAVERFGSLPLQIAEALLLAALVFLILTNSGSPGAFIYFQF